MWPSMVRDTHRLAGQSPGWARPEGSGMWLGPALLETSTPVQQLVSPPTPQQSA